MWRLLAQKVLLGWVPRPSHSLTLLVVLEAAQGYFQIGHNNFRLPCFCCDHLRSPFPFLSLLLTLCLEKAFRWSHMEIQHSAFGYYCILCINFILDHMERHLNCIFSFTSSNISHMWICIWLCLLIFLLTASFWVPVQLLILFSSTCRWAILVICLGNPCVSFTDYKDELPDNLSLGTQSLSL